MTDREKIIKGLECCLANDHKKCPYKSTDEGIDKVTPCTTYLMEDALALLKAQELIEARLHLCDSCTKKYPECDVARDGIEFGCGVGNDNIIGCTAYVNQWKAQEPRVMTIGDLYGEDIGYYERKDEELVWPVLIARGGPDEDETVGIVRKDAFEIKADCGLMNITWRIWTAYPNMAQREAARWC